ncbi:hypothetical protein L596_004930 [Steinernema carpocapsae]|uniref:Uncharacterized protein n=1 Tax=Steinernema carpocapsae TaxID=34508 RepID=A0A4U8UYY3_STECR|nr:hypothetical protein L596_004930 [Steinernema carpocapsae]
MSRPGAWGRVWSLLSKSFNNNVPKKYIAEDSFGNKFYEFQKSRSNIMRGYDPPAVGEVEKPSIEWEAPPFPSIRSRNCHESATSASSSFTRYSD